MNQLAADVKVLKADRDDILGVTEEGQAQMREAFAHIHVAVKFLHSKRIHVMVGTFQVWLILNILQKLGVDTTGIKEFITVIFTGG